MRFTILVGFLLAAKGALAANTCTTCYIDYENGNDTWDGTSKTFTSGTTGPWKHMPGMVGTGPSGGGTDGCTGNCGTQVPVAGDRYILKGGVVWPASTMPFSWTWSGTSTTSGAYGCTGTGCIYIGVDPTWNKGIVNAVIPSRDFGGCTVAGVSASITGGGGSSAAATANMIGGKPSFGDGSSYYAGWYTLTNQGSGYTSNPSVTVTGTGCKNIQAVADIQRAIFDGGAPSLDWTVVMNGTIGLMRFLGSYVIFDNVEVRNVKFNIAVEGQFMSMVSMGGTATTASNLYVHNFYPDAHPASGDGTSGIINTSQSGEISYSYVNDAEPSFTCPGGTTLCSWSAFGLADGAMVHHNHVSNGVWMFKSPNLGTTPTQTIHDNEAWGGMSSDSGAHLNLFYEGGAGWQVYIYNNIAYDNAGSTSQLPEFGGASVATNYYVFNNVTWNSGSGFTTFAIDNNSCTATGSSSCGPLHTHYYFWNNTCGGGYPNSFQSACINNGTGSSTASGFLDIDAYNNHAISDQSNTHWLTLQGAANTINGVSSPTQTTADSANLIQSLSTVNGQGYTITNGFTPTGLTNSTVTFAGTNLTSTSPGCGSSNLGSLCNDINIVGRSVGGNWQAGAYWFLNAIITPAPVPLMLISYTGHGNLQISLKYLPLKCSTATGCTILLTCIGDCGPTYGGTVQ